MKQRVEIKAIAKAGFKEQRSASILIVLVFFLVVVVASLTSLIPIIGVLFSLGVSFIISPVLGVGLYGVFLSIYRKTKTDVNALFSKFGNDFARVLGGMLWMTLWVFLWSLLFIVPGIIKLYSYRLTPFILSEYPNIRPKDAILISKKMTEGYKGALFINDLSFIGWFLLSSITMGILFIVYTGPYYLATISGFYEELKTQALASGAVKREELY